MATLFKKQHYLHHKIHLICGFYILLLIFFLLAGISPAMAGASSDPSGRTPNSHAQWRDSWTRIGLSKSEQQWLTSHPIITVGVRPGWMPIEFITEGREFRGITMDYLQ